MQMMHRTGEHKNQSKQRVISFWEQFENISSFFQQSFVCFDLNSVSNSNRKVATAYSLN